MEKTELEKMLLEIAQIAALLIKGETDATLAHPAQVIEWATAIRYKAATAIGMIRMGGHNEKTTA